jgi:hypothetical protein
MAIATAAFVVIPAPINGAIWELNEEQIKLLPPRQKTHEAHLLKL